VILLFNKKPHSAKKKRREREREGGREGERDQFIPLKYY